jgi:K+-sensing histidine kinase KdpD
MHANSEQPGTEDRWKALGAMAEYLSRQPGPLLLVLGLVLILLIGFVDYVTGYEISFSIFYLLPIVLVTWLVGWRYGIASAILSATVWLMADLLVHPPYSSPLVPLWNAMVRLGFFVIVVTVLSRLEQALNKQRQLIAELREALSRIRTLSGLLPICASCKRIRDDQGYWNQLEAYIQEHSEVEFSHGICPECARKLYPELYQDS